MVTQCSLNSSATTKTNKKNEEEEEKKGGGIQGYCFVLVDSVPKMHRDARM